MAANRAEIEAELTREVESARSTFVSANAALELATASMPRKRAPKRIGKATQVHRAAHESFARAMRRFNQFILDGIVPDDLR